MTEIPYGYKLVRFHHPDGTESLVMIEDEFVRRIERLNDRTIEIPEAVPQ